MNELHTTQFKYKQVDMNDFWKITNNLASSSRQMLPKNTTLHFCCILYVQQQVLSLGGKGCVQHIIMSGQQWCVIQVECGLRCKMVVQCSVSYPAQWNLLPERLKVVRILYPSRFTTLVARVNCIQEETFEKCNFPSEFQTCKIENWYQRVSSSLPFKIYFPLVAEKCNFSTLCFNNRAERCKKSRHTIIIE